MRKRIIDQLPKHVVDDEHRWLDLTRIASVEVTSEDKSYPIESAFLIGAEAGWRASGPGEQTFRLLFDEPQHIRLIRLQFIETEKTRTQEYVLRWSRKDGLPNQEILRQQYNFSPPGLVSEWKVHALDLERRHH